MDTVVFFTGNDGGEVVSPGVHFSRGFKHALRAKMNTQLAAFAAIGNEENLASWDDDFVDVQRLAIEDIQESVLSIQLPLMYGNNYTEEDKSGQQKGG